MASVWIKGQPITTSKQAAEALFRGFATQVMKMSASQWQRQGFKALAPKPSKYFISIDTNMDQPANHMVIIGKGLKFLAKLIQNEARMTTILTEAYRNTVSKDLAFNAYGGGGALGRDWPVTDLGGDYWYPGEAGGGTDPNAKWLDPGGSITPKSAEIKMGFRTKVHSTGKTSVGLNFLRDFIANPRFNVGSITSKFTSAFMMIEFGTGAYANKSTRRGFGSTGSTPFKVPPGGPGFYPRGSWIPFRTAMDKYLQYRKAFQNPNARKKRGQRFSNKEMIRYYSGTREGDKRVFNRKKPENGWDGLVSKGRRPAQLVFTIGGKVRERRKAIDAAKVEVVRLLNQAIRNRVKGWPEGVLVLGSGGIVIAGGSF